jgi:hypothetical protein
MERPENNKWLDEALTETIGSEKPRTNFEQWKQQHPEAVKMLTSRAGKDTTVLSAPLKTRRIIMTSTLIKLAAAAVVAVAAIAGIYQLTNTDKDNTHLLAGPMTYKLADDSQVELAQGAQIRVNDAAGTRGFEHVAGQIDVSVTKGKGEFVVTTPYGNVTALGTQFKLDLIDDVEVNTKEKIQLLAVEVKEGSVEVSNTKGSCILEASRWLIVESDRKPYDYYQDENLPLRLRERIHSAVEAMEAGDSKAYIANYNVDYMYKLIKGQVEYDPNLFGGSKEDTERLQKMGQDVNSPQELIDFFTAMGGIKAQNKLYIRSVELNETGDHAVASCVERKGPKLSTITTPQWHYFDNDWWQIDD